MTPKTKINGNRLRTVTQEYHLSQVKKCCVQVSLCIPKLQFKGQHHSRLWREHYTWRKPTALAMLIGLWGMLIAMWAKGPGIITKDKELLLNKAKLFRIQRENYKARSKIWKTKKLFYNQSLMKYKSKTRRTKNISNKLFRIYKINYQIMRIWTSNYNQKMKDWENNCLNWVKRKRQFKGS